MKNAIVILVIVVIAFIGLSSFNNINNNIEKVNNITAQLKTVLPTDPIIPSGPNKKGTGGVV